VAGHAPAVQAGGARAGRARRAHRVARDAARAAAGDGVWIAVAAVGVGADLEAVEVAWNAVVGALPRGAAVGGGVVRRAHVAAAAAIVDAGDVGVAAGVAGAAMLEPGGAGPIAGAAAADGRPVERAAGVAAHAAVVGAGRGIGAGAVAAQGVAAHAGHAAAAAIEGIGVGVDAEHVAAGEAARARMRVVAALGAAARGAAHLAHRAVVVDEALDALVARGIAELRRALPVVLAARSAQAACAILAHRTLIVGGRAADAAVDGGEADAEARRLAAAEAHRVAGAAGDDGALRVAEGGDHDDAHAPRKRELDGLALGERFREQRRARAGREQRAVAVCRARVVDVHPDQRRVWEEGIHRHGLAWRRSATGHDSYDENEGAHAAMIRLPW